MGDTHFYSNVKGRDGDEELSGFGTIKGGAVTATTLTEQTTLTMPSTTAVTNPSFSGGSYLKLGNNLYVMWGVKSLAASLEAVATALCTSTPEPGCVYITTWTQGAAGVGASSSAGIRMRGHVSASWGLIGWV